MSKRYTGGQGGIFTQSAPIHVSNVALLDPVDGLVKNNMLFTKNEEYQLSVF